MSTLMMATAIKFLTDIFAIIVYILLIGFAFGAIILTAISLYLLIKKKAKLKSILTLLLALLFFFAAGQIFDAVYNTNMLIGSSFDIR